MPSFHYQNRNIGAADKQLITMRLLESIFDRYDRLVKLLVHDTRTGAG